MVHYGGKRLVTSDLNVCKAPSALQTELIFSISQIKKKK